MDEETRARWVQAFGAATGMHEERRQALVEHLDALTGDYDLQALDAAREAAHRYVVAASELRGFRWALRQALEDREIEAMVGEAGTRWDEILAPHGSRLPPSIVPDDDEQAEL